MDKFCGECGMTVHSPTMCCTACGAPLEMDHEQDRQKKYSSELQIKVLILGSIWAGAMVALYMLGGYLAGLIDDGTLVVGKSLLGLLLMALYYGPALVFWAVQAVPPLALLILLPYWIAYLTQRNPEMRL